MGSAIHSAESVQRFGSKLSGLGDFLGSIAFKASQISALEIALKRKESQSELELNREADVIK